jgi:hypothetical protein
MKLIKTPTRRNNLRPDLFHLLARTLVVAGILLWGGNGWSSETMMPGTNSLSTYIPLDSWSFTDTNGWTSDTGQAPLAFTNITGMDFGDGTSLVVNSTNPAWLQYAVSNSSATNLTLDQGSIFLWFSPAWSSVDQGGTGPGVWGRLIEVGTYTNDASLGWWSLYEDDVGANLYFTVQPGDGSTTTYLQAPISWVSNYWHCITLTYCATNTALYLDGELATNGPGITAWPGTNVQAGGFYIGSDSGTGLLQAQGAFDDLFTYNVPLDSDTVSEMFNDFYAEYYLDPFNWEFVASIISAPSSPSTNYYTYDIITGTGNLQQVGSVSAISSTNVWITNVLASIVGSGTNNMRLQFTIQGGSAGLPYDTFVNSVLDFSTNTNKAWAWMGQGYQGNTYVITNLPSTACFLILGTPQDADGDGLTDAYERLVSKTNPNVADTSGDGISDSDKILEGLNPLLSYPQWKLDSDDDCLPDAYESATTGLLPGYAEPPPGLPSYSTAPIQ